MTEAKVVFVTSPPSGAIHQEMKVGYLLGGSWPLVRMANASSWRMSNTRSATCRRHAGAIGGYFWPHIGQDGTKRDKDGRCGKAWVRLSRPLPSTTRLPKHSLTQGGSCAGSPVSRPCVGRTGGNYASVPGAAVAGSRQWRSFSNHKEYSLKRRGVGRGQRRPLRGHVMPFRDPPDPCPSLSLMSLLTAPRSIPTDPSASPAQCATATDPSPGKASPFSSSDYSPRHRRPPPPSGRSTAAASSSGRCHALPKWPLRISTFAVSSGSENSWGVRWHDALDAPTPRQ